MANEQFEREVKACSQALEITLMNCAMEEGTTVGGVLNSFWTQNVELPATCMPKAQSTQFLQEKGKVYNAAVKELGLDSVKEKLVSEYLRERP